MGNQCHVFSFNMNRSAVPVRAVDWKQSLGEVKLSLQQKTSHQGSVSKTFSFGKEVCASSHTHSKSSTTTLQRQQTQGKRRTRRGPKEEAWEKIPQPDFLQTETKLDLLCLFCKTRGLDLKTWIATKSSG